MQMKTKMLYCPDCKNANLPQKNTEFIFVDDEMNMFIKKCIWDCRQGWTPHLIGFSKYEHDKSITAVHITCSVIGCGVEVIAHVNDEVLKIRMLETRVVRYDKKHLDELLKLPTMASYGIFSPKNFLS